MVWTGLRDIKELITAVNIPEVMTNNKKARQRLDWEAKFSKCISIFCRDSRKGCEIQGKRSNEIIGLVINSYRSYSQLFEDGSAGGMYFTSQEEVGKNLNWFTLISTKGWRRWALNTQGIGGGDGKWFGSSSWQVNRHDSSKEFLSCPLDVSRRIDSPGKNENKETRKTTTLPWMSIRPSNPLQCLRLCLLENRTKISVSSSRVSLSLQISEASTDSYYESRFSLSLSSLLLQGPFIAFTCLMFHEWNFCSGVEAEVTDWLPP